MHGSKQFFLNRQRGVSLTGLIVVLAVIGVVAVVAMKVTPTFIEYRAVQGAMQRAKEAGGSPVEMARAFDKNASVNNIDAIRGRDLVLTRDGGNTELSFAYEKRIPLAGNVSLVIDYAGTTDKSGANPAKAESGAQASQ
jgi:type II secretory pathway pseudopilin PulG